MTREEKIDELYNFCNMHDSCDQCEFDDLSLDCEFEDMCNKKIDRFYDVMVGHETKVGEDITKEQKTIAEIVGVVKEDQEKSKTATDVLEEVKRSDTKWDSKIVRALNAITEKKEKSESNAEESAQSLLHGN